MASRDVPIVSILRNVWLVIGLNTHWKMECVYRVSIGPIPYMMKKVTLVHAKSRYG